MINWQPLVELIAANDSFLITSHCRADCDAIGSELGLALALESLGKRVQIINGDEIPQHITFMDPENRVEEIEQVPLETLRQHQVFVVVDTSAWGQLGPMADVLRGFQGERVVIDHHVSEDDFGAHVFKDATAEATGRLILELIEELGVDLTPEMAAPLFAAIATDTGWFRFSSVKEPAFEALAKLVAAGASPPETFSKLYEQHSLARLHLRGKILNHGKSECSGRLLWTYVSQKDFAETGAQLTDTEDAINMQLAVAGAEAAAMFVELEPEKTKVSLRAKGDFDVRAIAEQFGGGGHKAAAGITMSMPREEAQSSVLDALRASMGE
ncbi:MAG: bifunctional oligoribonuclease/PAP phosphatase NrnA [Lacipirellulaceae bacterium]